MGYIECHCGAMNKVRGWIVLMVVEGHKCTEHH